MEPCEGGYSLSFNIFRICLFHLLIVPWSSQTGKDKAQSAKDKAQRSFIILAANKGLQDIMQIYCVW